MEISLQKIDMVRDILDAANVQNCGETNEILTPDQPEELVCRPGYAGDSCDKIVNICLAQDPCENDGICRPKSNSEFFCDCPIGFTGDICQHSKNFLTIEKRNNFSLIFTFLRRCFASSYRTL